MGVAGWAVLQAVTDSSTAAVTSFTGPRDRARSGGGPSLVEAVTYRYGAHSSADALGWTGAGSLCVLTGAPAGGRR